MCESQSAQIQWFSNIFLVSSKLFDPLFGSTWPGRRVAKKLPLQLGGSEAQRPIDSLEARPLGGSKLSNPGCRCCGCSITILLLWRMSGVFGVKCFKDIWSMISSEVHYFSDGLQPPIRFHFDAKPFASARLESSLVEDKKKFCHA